MNFLSDRKLTPDDEAAAMASQAPTTVSGSGVSAFIIRANASRQRLEELESLANNGVWFPWNPRYKTWRAFTLCCTMLTVFYEPYMAAFGDGGNVTGGGAILGYLLIAVFVMDLFVNANLAYYDNQNEIVWDRTRIIQNYLWGQSEAEPSPWSMGGMFWIDLVGAMPFYVIVLAMAGGIGTDDSLTQYLGLFRLLRLVRLHRMRQLYEVLQYSTRISFMTLTLTRDFIVILIWTHLNACVFYFIAKQENFNPDSTWIGGLVDGYNGMERYTVTLYWSVTTFTTVGYGDFSPVNEIEQVFGMIYMLLNIILQAWVIGSITLLIVKQDESTGEYRETLERLKAYSQAHHLSDKIYRRLKTQVKLDFENSTLSDELVLKEFPVSIRRKVLRKLYLNHLLQTRLLQGVRQQFVDAFLTAAQVEIFSPGEEILTKGNISTDLYLLVGGAIQLVTRENTKLIKEWKDHKDGGGKDKSNGDKASSATGSDFESQLSDSVFGTGSSGGKHIVRSGEFVNAVGFFTETAQMATARTLTVCKVLTLPKAAYKVLSQEDFPEDAQKVLQNLLNQVKDMQKSSGVPSRPVFAAAASATAKTLNSMQSSGDDDAWPKSVRFEGHDDDDDNNEGNGDNNGYDDDDDDVNNNKCDVDDGENAGALTQQAFQLKAAKATLVDLVNAHAAKLRDDRTTRFLFAASRGDVSSMTVLLQKGLDPDAADYDKRTALMVSAMNGQVKSVRKLLELHADPNLVDMHGSSALSEAALNGQDECMEVLLEYGAQLCLSESESASILCQAVFDGDTKRLGRLIKAQIDVNIGDYDNRTAVHIAAAEGNLAALKVLVEKGNADLSVRDRWNNSVKDEAVRSKAGHVVTYLEKVGK